MDKTITMSDYLLFYKRELYTVADYLQNVSYIQVL
jgi:hypothetical protein